MNNLELLKELADKMNVSIRYVILRDGYNQLNGDFVKGKDIDILVHNDDREKFIELVKFLGWSDRGRKGWYHPRYKFLYQVTEFNQFEKEGLILDVRYQLVCRSIDYFNWIPLDMSIQNSVWDNRIMRGNFYFLSDSDQVVHLITHGIFDKQGKFENEYKKQISFLLKKIKKEDFFTKIRPVFFNFSEQLYNLLITDEYDKLYNAYLSFVGY